MGMLGDLLKGWQRGRAPFGPAAAPQPFDLPVPDELRRAVDEEDERRGTHEVVAAEGSTPSGDTWTLLYRPEGAGGRHYIALLLNGIVNDDGSGLDLPDTTEIGFCGGLKPGVGQLYIFGLVTSRIRTVRAESHEQQHRSEVLTSPLPEATATDGSPLRSFVIVRPPVDNVTALVGVDRDGQVVQRIPFLRH
jgi:hypothetical protein